MTMELEQLKSGWNNISTPEKNITELKAMLSENRHPVLKGIRRQLTIEITGWSVFLLCYYTMFDGDQKPVYINLVLVASVMLSLLHNVWGYRLSKNLRPGETLLISLQHYLSKMKHYALISIFSRILFFTGLVFFFSYNVSFSATKYYALAAGMILVLVQVWMLSRIWSRRINMLELRISEF